MQKILRNASKHIEFGAHHKPGLIVEQGEVFTIETNDNWFNLLGTPDAKPEPTKEPVRALQSSRANPVGGPIFIKGVEAGDTVAIHIQEIAVRDWGWTGTVKDFGQLAEHSYMADFNENFSTVIKHVPGPSGTLVDGEAVMNTGRETRWPLAPFVGCIFTAPERGIENTVDSQGPWGGNCDVRDVCAGNIVHLNAAHEGGLLFLGDVHASQGDSELTGIANETAADVVASCSVLKGKATPGVMRIEKPSSLVQIDSARNAGSIERAMTNCFINMIKWLHEDYAMDKREAQLHMTANSRVRINVYQFTSGMFTVGVEFPKQNL